MRLVTCLCYQQEANKHEASSHLMPAVRWELDDGSEELWQEESPIDYDVDGAPLDESKSPLRHCCWRS